jgi:hypothetical protein
MNNNPVDVAPKMDQLIELVNCCPQGHNLLNLDCPFRNIRKLNDDNLTKAIGQMSIEEVDAIIDYHRSCRSVKGTRAQVRASRYWFLCRSVWFCHR